MHKEFVSNVVSSLFDPVQLDIEFHLTHIGIVLCFRCFHKLYLKFSFVQRKNIFLKRATISHLFDGVIYKPRNLVI